MTHWKLFGLVRKYDALTCGAEKQNPEAHPRTGRPWLANAYINLTSLTVGGHECERPFFYTKTHTFLTCITFTVAFKMIPFSVSTKKVQYNLQSLLDKFSLA